MKVTIESDDITSIDGDTLYKDGAIIYIHLENGKIELEVDEQTINMLEDAIEEAKRIME